MLLGGVIEFEHMKNFRRLLEILEVDVDRLQPITHPVQFENIILPDSSFGGGFTNEYRETIERVKNFTIKNQTPTPSKKIYFYYGTSQTGEERLAEYFRSKGYEIFSPERLTLDAQLNLMINAESFASTLGSCSHNSLFLRKGAEAIFIPRAANRFTGYQTVINQVANLNAIYIDSSLSVFETFNGPYCFIISKQLKEFFGEEFNGYDEDDLKVFLTYARNSMSRGFRQNDAAMEYYGEVLQEFFSEINQHKDLMEAYGINFG